MGVTPKITNIMKGTKMLFRKSGDAGTIIILKTVEILVFSDRLQWPTSMTKCSNLNECNSNESLEIFKLLITEEYPPRKCILSLLVHESYDSDEI